jgi:DedD protein
VDEQLKRRLVGAVVLVSLAVIFLPMMLEGRDNQDVQIKQTNIPPKPAAVKEFKSSVTPIADDEPLIPPLPTVRPRAPEAPVAAPPQRIVEPLKEPAARSEPKAIAPPAPPVIEEAPVAAQPKVGIAAWVVQVVSLSNKGNADRLVADLQRKKFPAFLEQISVKGRDLYRVRVGPEIDRKRTEQMAQEIERQFKLKGQVIRYP